ncbi:MAG: hypothetical protein RR743_04030 [Oscillospiraceae bacterium]
MIKIRRAKLLALMITLALLSGCSGTARDEKNFSAWRESYLSEAEHQFAAELEVNDSEKLCEYTILYTNNDDVETVEIIEPELVASIKAKIEGEEAALCFDGAIIEAGVSVTEKLSPMMALPSFMKILKEGHIERVWHEKSDGRELLVSELEMPDSTRMTLWQDSDNMQPVFAAIRAEEAVNVKIKFLK